jgi:hypothetical protein
MTEKSIIQRRDLTPIWLKANEVVRHYEKAGGCISAVMGADYISVEYSKHPKALLFCSLCKRYNQCASKMAPHEVPCSAMHYSATEKACSIGGSFIYKCPVGFYFWTSPFFAGDSFDGTFLACICRGMDLKTAAIYGNAAGARAVLKRGPMEGNTNRAELEKFIKENPGIRPEEIKMV